MSDLQALIKSTLGVVPPAPTPPSYTATSYAPKTKKNGWAPERPEPRYDYRVDVSRQEYGHVYVTASSWQEAQEDVDLSDADWTDSGDIEVGDIEQLGSTPVNEEEIDDWDAVYGKKHDTDGQPKCSNCESMFDDANELTLSDDGDEWYCADCLSDNDE